MKRRNFYNIQQSLCIYLFTNKSSHGRLWRILHIFRMRELMNHQRFDFRGTGFSCLWLFIWTWVLTVITFGLFFPCAYSAQQRWISEHTFIGNRQLVFHGTGLGFFGTWLLIMVLTIITFGLYMPWGFCRLKRWQTNNLAFADEEFQG